MDYNLTMSNFRLTKEYLSEADFDKKAVDELELFMNNTREINTRIIRSFLPNVIRKLRNGKYDHTKAPKLWMFLVDDAAKLYNKEVLGGPRNRTPAMFGKKEREAVANSFANNQLSMLLNGERNDFNPKELSPLLDIKKLKRMAK